MVNWRCGVVDSVPFPRRSSMEGCPPFDIDVGPNLAGTLASVKTQVESLGGELNGDLNSGSLSGSVPLLGDLAADYSVTGTTVTVTITKKPLLVGCSLLESKVKEFFSTP
jgi:hypothetical protein